MMKYRKQLLTMSLLLLVGICALNAQIKKKVGDNNTRIDASAVFEIESTTQGFLPPRMTKVEMLAITNPVEGLMVYCTTCSVKSLFAYSGTDWLNIVNGLVDGSLSSNGTAGVSSYSSIGSTGTLKLGTAVSGVTQTINATVSTAGGTYSISTGAINGVTFAGSGTFPAGGSQDIVLTATGTPTAVGTTSFALNTSPSSSFTRETIDPASAVASYVSKAAAGTMTLGTAASGVTQTITANVTRVGPYNISTTALNGITFTGSGTYGATGAQDVILTASGTPSVAGTFTYAISGSPTVSFSREAIDPSSAVASYVSKAAAGTMTLGTAVSGVTQTITANVTRVGPYNISTTAINGITFAGSGSYGATGNQDIILTASGTPSVAGTFSHAISGSPTVSFSREAIDPSSAVASYVSKAAAGTMTLGTAVSGVTQTITANVTRVGPYNISTSTINGITFAGSGSYGATGNRDIILTASGTPSAGGSFTYAISGSPTVSFSREAIDPSSAVASYVSKAAAGTMILGTAASGVTQTITADVTRVGPYSISTSTISGITFAGSGSYGATGAQDVILTASGTPSAGGSFTYAISGSPTVSFSRESVAPTPAANVTSSTNQVWMDRNLGATRVATSITDAASYGDLYQWGRGRDGHEIRSSGVTATLSSGDNANNGGRFITTNGGVLDWRSPQSDNLWQGVNGTNNPCPSGFRLPTSVELDIERQAFSSPNGAGAFASQLKLPYAGGREYANGAVTFEGSRGQYWSSSVGGSTAFQLGIIRDNAFVGQERRAYGRSVRCLKDGSSVAGTSAVASYVSKAAAGTMTLGTAVSGVTQTITANVTRVGPYNISTTAVNGITFAGFGTYGATGDQDVTLTASGTPSAVGTFSYAISGSPTFSFSRNAVAPTTIVVNTSASTTLTFMAHNLGANNSLDPHTPVQGIHGNYYQWGRSAIVADASTSSGAIYGWNSSSAANGAWSDGSKTANDPCPTGYRVPTSAQWSLVNSYNTQTLTGSFTVSSSNFGSARHFGSGANKLTLLAAGYRSDSDGTLYYRGYSGSYWSSTEDGAYANFLGFTSNNASTSSSYRPNGFSVRCVSE
jgi:uncharacterized protein (TIGR02145 family)